MEGADFTIYGKLFRENVLCKYAEESSIMDLYKE